MYEKIFIFLVVFTMVPFVFKHLLTVSKINTTSIANNLGKLLMSLPRPIMMILMAIPEQLVLAHYEPSIPLLKRLLVSVAMYTIHFAWNGMVMKPKKSYNELVWIIGTALFALHAIGVKKETAVALVAADSVMTLSLRGLA